MVPPNYPDVLGMLTGGPRCNVNVVQVALAVRPRVVRAGRPFEAVLVVQNAANVDVDVTATLHLPERDAKKQKGQFGSGHTRLLVGLRPAEVGYVTLPVTCATTTAVHDAYKIGMGVQVKPLSKPQRVRLAEGGGAVTGLNEMAQAELDELRALHFSVDRQFGLGDTLEVTFGVLPGKLGRLADTRPGWVSLWTMADYTDSTSLFAAHAPLLAESVLPALKPENTLEPLQAATLKRFEAAGYPLQPVEALFIAKLMAHVLQLAGHTTDDRADRVLDVQRTIDHYTGDDADADASPDLPNWCQAMLNVIANRPEAVRYPVRVVSELLYFDLLRDCVPFAVNLIERETRSNMGSPDEQAQYTEQLVDRMQAHDQIGFEDAYLPLLLGGLLVANRVVKQQEHIDAALRDLEAALNDRREEQEADNAPVFELADHLIENYSQQFLM